MIAVLLARRELEQVDSIDEPMEAGALGVEREDPAFRRWIEARKASTLLGVSR